MFVRATRVTKGDKNYLYGQIVESYRREDGKPRQRVIASLGRLSELQIENLRMALKAASDGKAVVCELAASDAVRVRRSLDYLPIAVVLRVAREMGLAGVLSRLLDNGDSTVAVSEMTLALMAHRLIAPGSKLAAVRWFERTALPELLGVERTELNNSRVHRVLNALDQIRPELQLGLSELNRDSSEAGGALFIDVSDTWFEGRGPSMAQRRKTKEGAYKKKIGIVLMVNRRGQPLRWEVVAGRCSDSKAMGAMARAVARISWMGELPMVFDRAMGKPAHLEELTDAGVRFVTLMTSETFASYAWDDLDVAGLDALTATSREDGQAQAAAVAAVDAAGFSAVGRRLWAKDLGVRHRREARRNTTVRRTPRSRRRRSEGVAVRVAEAMRLVEEMVELKEQTGRTHAEVAAHCGITTSRAHHLRTLLKLRPDIIERIKQEFCRATLCQLEHLAKLPHDEQWVEWERNGFDTSSEPEPAPEEACEQTPEPISWDLSGPPVRVLLAFDPVVFVSARFAAAEQDRELRDAFEALDRKVADGRMSQQSAERKAAKLLEKHSLTDCYHVETTAERVALTRREAVWERKRRTDGFRVFALHPDVDATPTQIIELYSAKMAVEVDFHVIKSTVQVRPVHHSTDAKVLAHVDLCMLALAVERALDDALPDDISAPAALELLETVRMTEVAVNGKTRPTTVLTTATPQQQRILEHLGMLDLARLPAP